MNYEMGMAIIDPVTTHEANWRDKSRSYIKYEKALLYMLHPNGCEPLIYLDRMITIIYYLHI